jgi:hypothetical protein
MAEGAVSDVTVEITKQSHESSVGRLAGRDHFAYRIPAAGSNRSGKTHRTCKACDGASITLGRP